jgi:hypothetical protein
MSTKIYQGYRFPKSRVNEFILLFNHICHRSVCRLLKKYRISDKEIKDTREQIFGKNIEGSKRFSNDDICLVWQLVQWMRASKAGMNDPLNMDCSFNLWFDNKWAYMIPYVANGMNMEKLMPKWCEFYGYWDNTDPQEGVSDKEWQKRKTVWDENVTDWDKTRLSHIVFEMKMPYLNGLRGLLRSIKRDKDWGNRIYMAVSALYWMMDKKDSAKK